MSRFRLIIYVLLVSVVGASSEDFQGIKCFGIDGAIISSSRVREWHKSIREGRGEQHGIQNILGVEAEGFWTPVQKDIELAESQLRSALEEATVKPESFADHATTPSARLFRSKQTVEILNHYHKYKRQYIGLVIGGVKTIFINSFLTTSKDGREYRKDFITACDGGYRYWRILYSTKTRSFSGLSINGYA